MLHQYFYSEKSKNIYFDSYPANKKTATAIIFLHGITGSRRGWGDRFKELQDYASLYFVDLIGFGFSAKPNIPYTLENHLYYLHEFTKKHVQAKNIILVGHSFGAIIALAYTTKYPQKITKTFLISLPYFHTPQEAEAHIRQSQVFSYFASDTLWTHITCLGMCTILGPVSRQLLPLFYRRVPKTIMQDYFRHSYRSVMQTLQNVVYKQNVSSYFTSPIKNKLTFIHGTKDKTAPLSSIKELVENYHLPLQIVPQGTHYLPFQEDEFVTSLIKKELAK